MADKWRVVGTDWGLRSALLHALRQFPFLGQLQLEGIEFAAADVAHDQ